MNKQFKNLLKGIVIYGFGNVSVKLVGLVLMQLYTDPKILSVEEFSVFGVLDISTQVIVSFFSLALYTAYIRWYWDKNYVNERKSILFSCFLILSIIGIIISVSGVIISKPLSTLLLHKEIFSYALELMIIGSALQFINDLTLSQMRVEEKPTFYITTNTIRLVISLLATIYFLKFQHRGVGGIYEALLIGNIAFSLITLPYVLKHIEFKFNTPVIKEMLHYSLPIAIASISGVLLAGFDRYVLNFKSTLLNVGVYTLGFKLANTIKVFVINSVQIALTPTYFKLMNHPDHKAIYSRIMIWFSILVIFSSLFISLFGLELTKLFSKGTIYWDAYKVIPILNIGIIFSMLKDSSTIGLQIVKKTKILGIVLSGIAVLSLILNLILVPKFGTIGAASSSAVSQIIYFIIIHSYAQKHYRIPYRIDKVFVMLILSTIIFLVSLIFDPYSTGIRISVKLFLCIVFIVMLFIFKIFDKSEIVAFKSFIISFKYVFNKTEPKEINETISEITEE